jgi:hypothetical protein
LTGEFSISPLACVIAAGSKKRIREAFPAHCLFRLENDKSLDVEEAKRGILEAKVSGYRRDPTAQKSRKRVTLHVQNTDFSAVDSKPESSLALVHLLNDYQAATEQYDMIVRYLNTAIEILTKTECQLLLEFAENAKDHCERLHRIIGERFETDRKSA